jgi:hypothetical protein
MESCGSFPSLVLVICFSVNILVYTLRNMFIGKLLRTMVNPALMTMHQIKYTIFTKNKIGFVNMCS